MARSHSIIRSASWKDSDAHRRTVDAFVAVWFVWLVSVMRPEWVIGRPVVLNERELLPQPRRRRAACERRPLPAEVRLVAVAAPGGDLRQRPSAEQAARLLEASHPLELLRCDAALVPHQRRQPTSAVSDLVG